jgi:hypothetical protein
MFILVKFGTDRTRTPKWLANTLVNINMVIITSIGHNGSFPVHCSRTRTYIVIHPLHCLVFILCCHITGTTAFTGIFHHLFG